MNVSAAVEEFVMQAVERGYPLEIYEFGKKSLLLRPATILTGLSKVWN